MHLVAIAGGPGVTWPFWEIPRPYQATSKTFIPRAIVRALVEKLGGDQAGLRVALKKHGEAVVIQVESLLPNSTTQP
ncbi:MAG TPA: hypothetical protein DDZ88_22415 [Verrucomicrobiales bacterium]|nr:hypothetical protein [Verrucomicrobiales bacterium]